MDIGKGKQSHDEHERRKYENMQSKNYSAYVDIDLLFVKCELFKNKQDKTVTHW